MQQHDVATPVHHPARSRAFLAHLETAASIAALRPYVRLISISRDAAFLVKGKHATDRSRNRDASLSSSSPVP